MSEQIPEVAVEAAVNRIGPAVTIRDIITILEAAAPHMRRTITTAEELDELPAGSVIRDPLNCIKWGDGSWGTFTDDTYPSSRIDLPATVLYEPDPAK